MPDHRTRLYLDTADKWAAYKAWANMKQRCYNRKHEKYKDYGGRGIKVCLTWMNDFDAFFAYIGPRPGPRYLIDRIDNDGNYKPGNVKWSTIEQSAMNKRPRKKL